MRRFHCPVPQTLSLSYRRTLVAIASPIAPIAGKEEVSVVCAKRRENLSHPSLERSDPTQIEVSRGNMIETDVDALEGFYGRPFPLGPLVDYSSSRGKTLFGEALATGDMNPFFRLAGAYAHQSEPAYCALAVLAMVLNSLQVDPGETWRKPWRWFSEEMLACCTDINVVRQKGIMFDQFVTLASCKGGLVQAWRYADSTLEEFREAIKRSVRSDDEVVVASFRRKDLGQTGGGHFAPIAGYHIESDAVLLLEVARFKYPSHWVPVPILFEAMKAVDPETNLSRGYLSVRPARATPLGTGQEL